MFHSLFCYFILQKAMLYEVPSFGKMEYLLNSLKCKNCFYFYSHECDVTLIILWVMLRSRVGNFNFHNWLREISKPTKRIVVCIYQILPLLFTTLALRAYNNWITMSFPLRNLNIILVIVYTYIFCFSYFPSVLMLILYVLLLHPNTVILVTHHG